MKDDAVQTTSLWTATATATSEPVLDHDTRRCVRGERFQILNPNLDFNGVLKVGTVLYMPSGKLSDSVAASFQLAGMS